MCARWNVGARQAILAWVLIVTIAIVFEPRLRRDRAKVARLRVSACSTSKSSRLSAQLKVPHYASHAFGIARRRAFFAFSSVCSLIERFPSHVAARFLSLSETNPNERFCSLARRDWLHRPG